MIAFIPQGIEIREYFSIDILNSECNRDSGIYSSSNASIVFYFIYVIIDRIVNIFVFHKYNI